MRKIASPKELVQEIRSIIAYSESASPSREKLSSDLRILADRVGAASASSMTDTVKIPIQMLRQGMRILQNNVVYEVMYTPHKRRVVNQKGTSRRKGGGIRWLYEFSTNSIFGVERRSSWHDQEWSVLCD